MKFTLPDGKALDFDLAVELPEDGVGLDEAHVAIEQLRGKPIQNRSTGIVARLSSSAKGKLVSNKAAGKSIKLEALDRIVEVVSGNTPHASSAPTRGIIATLGRFIKGVFA